MAVFSTWIFEAAAVDAVVVRCAAVVADVILVGSLGVCDAGKSPKSLLIPEVSMSTQMAPTQKLVYIQH